MPIDYFVESIESLPENIRPLYVPREDGDGKGFVLDVKGAAPKSKVDEFRANNVRLAAEKAALEERYKGVDPAEYAKIKAEFEQVKNGSGEVFNNLVQRNIASEKERFEADRKKLADELAQERAQREKLTARAKSQALSASLRATLEQEKVSLRSEGAMRDLALRAANAFDVDLDTGKLIPRDTEGEPVGPKAWLKRLISDPNESHLFAQAEGGNASGNKNGKPAAKPGRIQMTQAEALRPSKEQAEAMAANLVDYV